MFPDSGIAKFSSIQMTKFAYTIHVCLAPLFSSELMENIKKSPFYTISLDKSISDNLENNRMDFIVILWDQETESVAARYYGSKFLCSSNAKGLQ